MLGRSRVNIVRDGASGADCSMSGRLSASEVMQSDRSLVVAGLVVGFGIWHSATARAPSCSA